MVLATKAGGTASTTKLAVGIGTYGKAYVKGYELEKYRYYILRCKQSKRL